MAAKKRAGASSSPNVKDATNKVFEKAGFTRPAFSFLQGLCHAEKGDDCHQRPQQIRAPFAAHGGLSNQRIPLIRLTVLDHGKAHAPGRDDAAQINADADHAAIEQNFPREPITSERLFI